MEDLTPTFFLMLRHKSAGALSLQAKRAALPGLLKAASEVYECLPEKLFFSIASLSHQVPWATPLQAAVETLGVICETST